VRREERHEPHRRRPLRHCPPPFAGGPPPEKAPKYGRERVVYEWRDFGKAVVAWAISCGLMELAILVVGNAKDFDRDLATFGKVTPIDISIPQVKSGMGGK